LTVETLRRKVLRSLDVPADQQSSFDAEVNSLIAQIKGIVSQLQPSSGRESGGIS
jgi:hypothetical protein